MSEPEFNSYLPGQTQDLVSEMFNGRPFRTVGGVHGAFARGELAPAEAAEESSRIMEAHRFPWGAVIGCALFTAAFVGLGLFLFLTKAVAKH